MNVTAMILYTNGHTASKQILFFIQEYLGVVRDSLATTGSECNAAISSSTGTVTSMMKSESGRKELKSLFRWECTRKNSYYASAQCT